LIRRIFARVIEALNKRLQNPSDSAELERLDVAEREVMIMLRQSM